MIKKIITYILVIAMLISGCSLFVFADEITSTPTIWEWLLHQTLSSLFGADSWVTNSVTSALLDDYCAQSSDSFHHCSLTSITGFGADGADCVCALCGETFHVDNVDMQTSYNTQVDAMPIVVCTSSGEYYVDFSIATPVTGGYLSVTGGTCIVDNTTSQNVSVAYESVSFDFPVSGTYYPNFLVNGEVVGFSNYLYYGTSNLVLNSGMHFAAGFSCKKLSSNLFHYDGNTYSVVVPFRYRVVPDAGQISTDDYAVDTRPTGIAGDFVTIGDDNVVTRYENCTLVDETNTQFYNPVTNTTTTYNSYTYDYTTRTYNFVTNEGSTTITYGDEYVTYNETVNNVTNVYNYYYSIDNGGGSGGDVPSGDSSTIIEWLEKIYNKLVLLVNPDKDTDGDGIPDSVDTDDGDGEKAEKQNVFTSIIRSLGNFFTSVIDGIVKIISDIVTKIFGVLVNAVTKLFDFITGFFDGLFLAPGDFVTAIPSCLSFLGTEETTTFSGGYSVNVDAAGDATFAAMLSVAEAQLGIPYVWGGSAPAQGFDCSGFVCYVFNQSGVYPIPRTTAQGICNACTVVAAADAQPGDLIFFKNTGGSASEITHCAIYVGDGVMIHAGNPVQYADMTTTYWQNRLVSFGRPDYVEVSE